MAVVEQAISFERFLAWLSRQEMRYEYDRGRITPRHVAMPGAAARHDEVEVDLLQELANRFEGTRWRAYTSGKLIATADGEVGYFPDATLIEGAPQTVRYGNHKAAVNPAAVFEIGSPGTEEYDRGRKLEVYKSIPTMREVVLLKSDEARAVRHFRVGDGWDAEEVVGLDARLTVLGVEIPLARIYRNVALP